jgi:hypothetical protein
MPINVLYYYNFGFNNMRCFVKKNVLEKKLVRGSIISKDHSSGVRVLQKVKNRCYKQFNSSIMCN